MSAGTDIAVAIHDVEPATFARCARIRDWLGERGVARATLLVIPAADLHPFDRRSPAMAEWLAECARGGDAVAQHGFTHRQTHRGSVARQWLAGLQGGPSAEFVGLDSTGTRRALHAGLRLMREAGFAPRGFVAPAYAYTRALRHELAATFEWWADLWSLWRGPSPRLALSSPALSLGGSTRLKRLLSPAVVRGGSLGGRALLRLDLHPDDLGRPGHLRALESTLARASARRSVTYDELLARR